MGKDRRCDIYSPTTAHVGRRRKVYFLLLQACYNRLVFQITQGTNAGCKNRVTFTMGIMTILKYPDPRLRQKALPVAAVNANTRSLIEDMFETMWDANGIGLAATQVDVHERVIVMDLEGDRAASRVYINPKIKILDATCLPYDEGCLSIPETYETVERPGHVMITALDRDGAEFKEEAKGLLAVCIQHEIDHLEGKLFVDYLSSIKRQRIRKKLKKNRA